MGWFGKLPAVGDFAGRGLPRPVQETVHQWMSSGMAQVARLWPQEWQAAYLVSPVWHFVINAGTWDNLALAGCIAPSVDKVGRYSPLMVLRSFDKRDIDLVLPPGNTWLYQVDELLRRVISERIAVDDVLTLLTRQTGDEGDLLARNPGEDILGDLGIVDGTGNEADKGWFSWPDLPALFLERIDRSFWWAEPSPKSPPRQITHRGLPDEHLFCLLMDGGVLSE
jgi:type VI secretion system protein ImpM